MIIFWRGLGYLVAVVVFGCSLVFNLLFNLARGKGYYDQHRWPFGLSMIVAAIVCWQLGNYLRRRSDRVAIDKETGEEFIVNNSRHSLFFVPVEWWGPILLVIAVVAFFDEFRR